MIPLDAASIRASFVNATAGEIDRIPLPGLHEVMWDAREYLGWRDPRAPQRGYLVHTQGAQPVGIVLRASETRLRSGIQAMCSLCRTMQPAGQVSMFTAARAGQPGRDGNTLGTYICDDLACSHLIRILPPRQPMQIEPEEILASRIDGLQQRVLAFTTDVQRPVS